MIRLFLLTLLTLYPGIISLQAKIRVINLADLGILPNSSTSTTLRINQLIDSLSLQTKQGDRLVLRMEPGTYYFDAIPEVQEELYISNHDQIGRRPIGIHIQRAQNLHLDAQGSRFIFRDSMLPIAIRSSRGVLLKGFSIDFTDPQIGQAEVIENRGKGGICFRPAPWVKWRQVQGMMETYGSNWNNLPRSGIVFELDTYHTAYRISDLDYSTEGVYEVSPGVLHAPRWVDERLRPGQVIAMRSYDRPNPALFIDDCQDTRLEQIRIHFANGMGVLAQNSHNVTLTRVDVALEHNFYQQPSSPKNRRYFTTQADATHFSGCSGHIEVSEGLFEHMMDDAINVHGIYLKLTKRLDNHTIEAQYMHEQAWGFEWGRAGDPVQFVYSKTFDSLKKLYTIQTIIPEDKPTVLGAKVFRIRFTSPLPETIKPEASISLENMRKTPSVRFARNIIRNNRARGTLLNSPKRIEVIDNVFDHISGAAIIASTDCNQWYESGQTQKLLIRGNLFENVLTSLYQFTDAVISLHPVIPDLEHQKEPFYGNDKGGICIENNHFRTFDTPLLFARSVKGLIWRRNTITETNAYPKYHWNQERYKLEGSRNISITE